MAKKPKQPEPTTMEDVLKKLLVAENNQWGGTISRLQLRKIADEARAQLKEMTG